MGGSEAWGIPIGFSAMIWGYLHFGKPPNDFLEDEETIVLSQFKHMFIHMNMLHSKTFEHRRYEESLSGGLVARVQKFHRTNVGLKLR